MPAGAASEAARGAKKKRLAMEKWSHAKNHGFFEKAKVFLKASKNWPCHGGCCRGGHQKREVRERAQIAWSYRTLYFLQRKKVAQSRSNDRLPARRFFPFQPHRPHVKDPAGLAGANSLKLPLLLLLLLLILYIIYIYVY